MSWRYKQKPGDLYQYISIRGGDRSLLGVVVFRVVNKHGGKIGYVMDVVTDPDNTDVATMLVQASIAKCYEQRADVVFAWSPKNPPLGPAYSSALFFPMARSLQPIKLHFGGRRFSTGQDRKFQDEFFISYADSDTV